MNSSILTQPDWSDQKKTKSFIKSLQCNRSLRNKHKLFVIEGVRNFIQAVNNNRQIVVIYYSDRLLIVPTARQLLRKLRRSGIPCINVAPEEFRQVSTTQRASGIAAIVTAKSPSLHNTPPRSGLCWIVLDSIRSAGNFGSLIRTSDAIGGAGFILLNRNTDPYSPTAIRAAMGSIFSQHFIYTSATQLQHWMNRHKCQLIGAAIDAKTEFQRFDYPPTPLLFLGEEQKGLTLVQKNRCHHLVRIPMTGQTDSLNLAVAGSLLMYEIYRMKQ